MPVHPDHRVRAPHARSLARWAVLAVVLGLLLARAHPFLHRIFNWDELGLLSQAWIQASQGWRSESRPGLVLLLLRPLMGLSEDQVVVMYAGRALAAVALAAVYGGAWALGRSLYGRTAAGLGLLILSFHSMFFAFSVELRTETFALAFALWGLWWMEHRARAGRDPWPGIILLALAALCSQKALYPALWYAVGHAAGAGARWSVLRQRALLVGIVAPPVLFIAAVLIGLPLPEVLPYLRRLTLGALEEARSPFYIEWVQWTYVKWSLEREPAFYLAPALALPFLLRRRMSVRWRLVAALAQQAMVAAILWFHAARFPYFFITLAPLWALPAGYELSLALTALGRVGAQRLGGALAGLGLGAAAAALVVPFWEQRGEVFQDTVGPQLETIRTLAQVFPPGTPAFDAHHLMIFHEQATTPLYGRAVNFLKQEPAAEEAFVRQLREARPVYYLQSKRTEKLTGAPADFLRDHFVRLAPNIYMAGWRLTGSGPIEVIVPGRYKLTRPVRDWGEPPAPPWPAEGATIDGREVQPGRTVELSAGWHDVVLRSPGAVRIRLAWKGIEAIEKPDKRNVQLFRPYK